MNCRSIIGSRIVAVHHERFWCTRVDGWRYDIRGISLDNGSTVWLAGQEAEDDGMLIDPIVEGRLSVPLSEYYADREQGEA